MKTIPLGSSGVQVSALCLGAMMFGTKEDETISFRLLDQYMDAGGSFIDTANIYSHWVKGFRGGESESLLGRWFQQRGNRARVFLASKVGFDYPGVARGASARQIQEECEKSLRRLGVDTIDLYYIHKDDRATPPEETLAALDALVKAGKVRFIGASNFLAWRLEEARWISQTHGWSEFCCLQQRHTYLRPRPGTTFDPQAAINEDLLDYGRSRDITLLAYSALLGGAYTRPEREVGDQYLGPDSDARLTALKQVAEQRNASPNQVILAWMLAGSPRILPLIAASTPEQLDENIRALDLTLSAEEMALLDGAGA